MAEEARLPKDQAVSAGGVVYRSGARGLEVLLLETPTGIWGLPKGTPDAGESLGDAARREVREETGLAVALEEKIGAIAYWFSRPGHPRRTHKTVHFWLMRPVGGAVADHDGEHVTVDWFPIDAALARVTHANTADLLRAAVILLDQRTGRALPGRDRPGAPLETP